MNWLGTWIGAGFGLVFVMVCATLLGEPLHAAAPAPAAAAAQAVRVHAFAPRSRAAARAQLPKHGAAFLSKVAGDVTAGAPPVAAVREEGKLRLVQAGDLLDGAVVASIEADTLTLRTADATVVMPRAR